MSHVCVYVGDANVALLAIITQKMVYVICYAAFYVFFIRNVWRSKEKKEWESPLWLDHIDKFGFVKLLSIFGTNFLT